MALACAISVRGFCGTNSQKNKLLLFLWASLGEENPRHDVGKKKKTVFISNGVYPGIMGVISIESRLLEDLFSSHLIGLIFLFFADDFEMWEKRWVNGSSLWVAHSGFSLQKVKNGNNVHLRQLNQRGHS